MQPVLVAPVAHPVAPREAYADLLGRLSARSVTKHYDAYADVGWDDPANAVDRDDPRFELSDDDPLGATAWYRALPQAARARLGLHHLVRMMKTGVEFEAVLSRGLLEFASTRPNGSPEFRYAYHEVIEESQHSLMFQEFVNRSGFDVRGLGALEALGARRVPRLGRTFPEAFFLHVLAGETPIDWVQRRALARSGGPPHPLVRRIMQIHVTEEARHLCFAQRFLEQSVPRLGAVGRARLRLLAPFILAGTVAPMLRVPADVVRAHAIPAEVVRAVHASPVHRARVREGIRPVRDLCERTRILTPRLGWLWSWLGL
jgi:hypothetical protein